MILMIWYLYGIGSKVQIDNNQEIDDLPISYLILNKCYRIPKEQ